MSERFYIGVDGGGSGCRARVEAEDGTLIGEGTGGPAQLSQGPTVAWHSIQTAIEAALGNSGFEPEFAVLGFGLAGAHVPAWRTAFEHAAPKLWRCRVETDAYTSLVGAHGGEPGVVVGIGTGTFACAFDDRRHYHEAGGWGFPSGDEGGGAWIGVKLARLAEQAIDGRHDMTPLAQKILEKIGPDRKSLFDWVGVANQATFAALTPIAAAAAAEGDAEALKMFDEAAYEITRLVGAVDPADAQPLALLGGLAGIIAPRLPYRLSRRLRAPKGDSAAGALILARREDTIPR
ncbi:BadF/BadG/BcrA/BcrD ATPase family protein [Lacibacterium aquatile]|uniref:BadF/BadG/BcrA/BcrD ATPase family protein n=1 Tax=Lacibacterium aquatile TaxID=1168082 RepID=A0ABW5DN15_9PROT